MRKVWFTRRGKKVTMVTDYFGGIRYYAVLATHGRGTAHEWEGDTEIENEFNNVWTRSRRNARATVDRLLESIF
jgi:hypothetical protein